MTMEIALSSHENWYFSAKNLSDLEYVDEVAVLGEDSSKLQGFSIV